MKKIILMLFIAFTLNSCNKDDDNSNGNRAELIIGLWKLETINGNDPFQNTVEPMVIKYEFESNGDFNYYVNDEIDEQSTWSLNADNSIVTFMNESFNISLLNNNNMKLILPSSNPNLSIEYGLKKME
ncbi:lipocalin family protein [Flavobacterium sp.]|uniref:lipocalin family protein n=1 Tax=Flavobacterium sp. TaxID=239 RepID=UPI004047B2EE